MTTPGTCRSDSCKKPVKARGLCSACYARRRRRGEFGNLGRCRVHLCSAKQHARGYCYLHYDRAYKLGFPPPSQLIKDGDRLDTSMWTRENLAWCAGWLEGEGCFRFYERDGVKSGLVTASSTDRDSIERLVDILRCGNICGPYQKEPRHKPLYRYQLQRARDVYAVCAALYGWMGKRRRREIRAVLRGLAAPDAPALMLRSANY